jgi:hypothetical protein
MVRVPTVSGVLIRTDTVFVSILHPKHFVFPGPTTDDRGVVAGNNQKDGGEDMFEANDEEMDEYENDKAMYTPSRKSKEVVEKIPDIGFIDEG